MSGKIFSSTLAFFFLFSQAEAANVNATALNATSVTTAGTAVTAILASSVFNGCYIQNDPSSGTNLVVDPVNTASHTSPSSTASFIPPGGTWYCPMGIVGQVTVDSYDNNHKFYGVKW